MGLSSQWTNLGVCLLVFSSCFSCFCCCGCSEGMSVLTGLMRSEDYKMLVQMMQKASAVEDLHRLQNHHNITILAPQKTVIGGELLRRFLLEEGNAALLRRVVEYHVLPRRISAEDWPISAKVFSALSTDILQLWRDKRNGGLKVGISVSVVKPDALLCADGIVHAIDSFLIPKMIQEAFLSWQNRSLILH